MPSSLVYAIKEEAREDSLPLVPTSRPGLASGSLFMDKKCGCGSVLKTKNEFRQNRCKPCWRIYIKNYLFRFPWIRNFNSIRKRCTCKSTSSFKRYGARGIKNFLTAEQVKQLWFRDKAYLMADPTVDRINSDGNYILENCRFLERVENSRLGQKMQMDKIRRENL